MSLDMAELDLVIALLSLWLLLTLWLFDILQFLCAWWLNFVKLLFSFVMSRFFSIYIASHFYSLFSLILTSILFSSPSLLLLGLRFFIQLAFLIWFPLILYTSITRPCVTYFVNCEYNISAINIQWTCNMWLLIVIIFIYILTMHSLVTIYYWYYICYIPQFLMFYSLHLPFHVCPLFSYFTFLQDYLQPLLLLWLWTVYWSSGTVRYPDFWDGASIVMYVLLLIALF